MDWPWKFNLPENGMIFQKYDLVICKPECEIFYFNCFPFLDEARISEASIEPCGKCKRGEIRIFVREH